MATTVQRARGAARARHGKLERLLDLQGAVLRTRKQALRGDPPSPTSGVLDFEEHALDAEEQQIGFAVLELTSRTVRGIETALQRQAEGELGTCSDCRCLIADARLRAVPFAARCLACQERHDVAADRRERASAARPGTLRQ